MPAKRAVASIFAALLLMFSLCILGACKPTDVIVEKIHDQNSPNTDYDNPNKIYLPDETSQQTVEDLDTDKDDSPNKDEVWNDLPDRQGKQDSDEVRQATYDAHANSTHTAARGESSNSTGKNEEPEHDDDESWQEVPSSNTGPGEGGEEQSGDSLDSETGSYGYNPDDDEYQDRTYDSRYGNTEDLPDDVTTIAATDELATMALVLGKEGTLAGSSADYLGNGAIADVFASKGVSATKAVWDGDGSKTAGADVDRIIDLKPDALLVYPGQLSGKQERVIGQNCPDTKIVTAPSPTSMGNIEEDVKIIAKLLKKSTNGTSKDTQDKYLEFTKNAIAAAKNAHGGGESTYGGIDYNNPNSSNPTQTADPGNGEPIWSLYISDWDDDAQVTATYQGSTLFTDSGVAYTHTGWEWSPLSYMMSVAGVINNAAAYGPLSPDKMRPVLGINETLVSYKWNNSSFDVNEKRGGGSFPSYRAYHMLLNARDAADSTQATETHPLGSDDFNTVLVKTRRIADALEAAKGEEDGLYTLYGYASTGSTEGYGRIVKGKEGTTIVWTTVKGDVTIDGFAGYKIVVNPCGYVGSWTDGSLEAPLEALWVASEFHDYSPGDLNDKIIEFYRTFYGYDIEPKLGNVLAGSYAQ